MNDLDRGLRRSALWVLVLAMGFTGIALAFEPPKDKDGGAAGDEPKYPPFDQSVQGLYQSYQHD